MSSLSLSFDEVLQRFKFTSFIPDLDLVSLINSSSKLTHWGLGQVSWASLWKNWFSQPTLQGSSHKMSMSTIFVQKQSRNYSCFSDTNSSSLSAVPGQACGLQGADGERDVCLSWPWLSRLESENQVYTTQQADAPAKLQQKPLPQWQGQPRVEGAAYQEE